MNNKIMIIKFSSVPKWVLFPKLEVNGVLFPLKDSTDIDSVAVKTGHYRIRVHYGLFLKSNYIKLTTDEAEKSSLKLSFEFTWMLLGELLFIICIFIYYLNYYVLPNPLVAPSLFLLGFLFSLIKNYKLEVL